MSAFIVSVAFFLTAGQPPAAVPAETPAPATQAVEPAKEEPKMVCKFEQATGSMRKTKVCRPVGGPEPEQSTALERSLARNGDMRVQGAASSFGN